jgi:hypothetical protein
MTTPSFGSRLVFEIVEDRGSRRRTVRHNLGAVSIGEYRWNAAAARDLAAHLSEL